MHEMTITESILRITLDHAQRANARSVGAIHIRMGELSSMVDDSIRFYWEIIAKDTLAEKAQLVFTRTPVRVHCATCQTDFDYRRKESFACPHCGGQDLRIQDGDEMQVESIEVETE
jgi:hydrogenase nickel incorporation protein HypA/HybF